MAGDCCSMICIRCLLQLQFSLKSRWVIALLGGILLHLQKIKQHNFGFFFQHVKKISISELFAHVMIELKSTHRHLSKTTFDFAYILIQIVKNQLSVCSHIDRTPCKWLISWHKCVKWLIFQHLMIVIETHIKTYIDHMNGFIVYIPEEVVSLQ